MRLTSSKRIRVAAIAMLVLVLSAIWTGIRLLKAKDHLELARAQLLTVKAQLLDQQPEAAAASLASAGRETAAARSLTHDPVSWVWGHVPVVGRPVAVARGLASGADDVTREVLPTALETTKVINTADLRRADGTIDLATVRRLGPPLANAAKQGRQVRDEVEDLPGGLLPAVNRARDSFRDQLRDLSAALTSASDAVTITPAFVGGEGEKRWFVLVMQTAESRGSGGIPGGFAVLRASNGKLEVEASGSNRDLKETNVIPPGIPKDYRDRWEVEGAFAVWPNVTLSPDFPNVAKVVAAKWRAQGGAKVDGVIAVDAVALSKLLKGGPPIQVGPRSVSADQLVDYLAVGQYEDESDLVVRKDRLSEIATTVIGRLTTGQGSSKDLIAGVSDALRSGHVRFASEQRPFRGVLSRTGLDGALPRGDAPVAYAVINNASAGKLDHFLAREITYHGKGCDRGRRDTSIVVSLTSHAPSLRELPSYVTVRADGEAEAHSSTGRILLDVYGTPGAVLVAAKLNGAAVSSKPGVTTTEIQVGSEAGLPVWRVPMETPPGQAQTLELFLSEPTVSGRPRVPSQLQDRDLVKHVAFETCG